MTGSWRMKLRMTGKKSLRIGLKGERVVRIK